MKRFAGSRWAAVGAAALVGLLLAVVAVVATGLPGTESTSSLGFDSDVLADLTGPVMRLLYGIALMFAVYRWMLGTRIAKRGRRRLPASPWALLAALALFAAVVLLVRPNLHFQGVSAPAASLPTTTAVPHPAAGPSTGTAPVLGPDIWIVVSAAVAGAAFIMLRRRSRPDGAPGPPPSGSSTPSSRWVEPDLATPGDARYRVFAAYRRVADRAAEAGLGRAASETVTSHLRRIRGPGGAEPTGRLAGLYNRARFSTHATSDSEADSAERVSEQIEEGIQDG